MNRLIEVVVSPSGDATIQTRGYSGGECLAASRFLEESLGIKARDQKTADFYEHAVMEEHVKQQ